jgi:molybdate transport system substrate-binding protein
MKVASLVVFCLIAIGSGAQDLTIAAAADLHSAMEEISAQFQSSTRTRVKVSYGSSGNLYQQIRNGAPFDVFFSADTGYPQRLEADGLVSAGSYQVYARGKLVLLVRSATQVNIAAGLKVLLDPAIKRIAIADPARAPYGQAAVAALKSQSLYDRVSAKIVTGESISQAVSFVLSGAADAGIVAKSLSLVPSSRGETLFAEIPSNEYPPIEQACVVLQASRQQRLAREFQSYALGPEGARTLQKYGFEVPARQSK